jgi:hypothetical protein
MKSFRVHASAATAEGRIPYLILNLVRGGHIEFDFRPLETEPRLRIPTLALSADALYEILEGKEVAIQHAEGTTTLSAFHDELLISSQNETMTPARQYRVWLAEIGLGWNMLVGPAGFAA